MLGLWHRPGRGSRAPSLSQAYAEGGLHDPLCDRDLDRVLADLEGWIERRL